VIKRFPSDKEKIIIMLASLCHDLGKPSTTEHHPDGSVSQHGHEVAGIDPTREFLSKLTRETDILEDVEFLVEHHLLPPNYYRAETSDATFRKLINRYGMRRLKLLAAVSEADILGRLNRAEDGGTEEPDNDATEWFNMRLDEVAEKSNLTLEGTIQPLITGHDLKDMGFKEGRELGDILRDIKSQQEIGQIADSSEAIEYVKETYMSKSLGDLVDWLFKAVSTESVAEAKRRGLVPQSGDWGKPRRWVRPEDAEKVPDSDVSDKREGASLVDGGVPAEYGNKLYPVGTINASLRKFFDRDDVDVSLLQNMYSIGGELSKEFGISFRTVDIKEYSSSLSDMPISAIEVDYQLDSKLPVPKKYKIGYMFTLKPMSREAYLRERGIQEKLNPSKESDYYTETIDSDLVERVARLVFSLYRRDRAYGDYTDDMIQNAIDKMVDSGWLSDPDIERDSIDHQNLVSALKERFTKREYEYLEDPDYPYDEYVKHFMDNYAKEVFSEYHLGYQDTYSPDGEFMSEDPLAMDSPEQARQWVEEHGYVDESGESIDKDFIIQETKNLEAEFQKDESHFARTISKYRDENTGEIRFEVLHREMTLAEPYQNKGIATNINEHAEEVYAKLGVSKITLQANYAVGGYTWARQGYDFIHRDDRIALKQMFTSEVKRKHQRGDISDNELDSLLLDVKSLQHAWEFAWWNPTDEVDGKHLGKEFMLGSDWMAQKSLNPYSLGYKIGKLYYAGKNKKASVTG
jgi:GNAT superfamily N-acetyltransferase